MARKDRDSEEWFVGSITNEAPRTLEMDLSFLDDGLDYRADIYADGDGADFRTNPDSVNLFSRKVHSGMSMHLELAAGGGTAIRLVPLLQE
jgi:alpha-glucosidase